VVYKGNMYLFGGRNKVPEYFRDLYRYHFASRTWYAPSLFASLSLSLSLFLTLCLSLSLSLSFSLFASLSLFLSFLFSIFILSLHSKRFLVETAFGVLPPRIYNHTAFTYRDSLYVFGGYGIEGEERQTSIDVGGVGMGSGMSGGGSGGSGISGGIAVGMGIGMGGMGGGIGGGERKKDASIGHRHSEVYEYNFTQNEWSMVKVTGLSSLSLSFFFFFLLIFIFFLSS